MSNAALDLFAQVVAAEMLPPAGQPDFQLVVFGRAQPAGSKRVVPIGKENHKRWIAVDANPKSRTWKTDVTKAAAEAMHGRQLFRGPLLATFHFFRSRPQGHYGTGRNAGRIRESAPKYPDVKPDLLKLARGVEDALQGVVYADDSQIVQEVLLKSWGEPERVEITIARLP